VLAAFASAYWTRRLRPFGAGIVIALGFFVISVITLPDYGRTWDEDESYDAAFLNVRIVKAVITGQPTPSWKLHEWPGYYFVVDSLSAGFIWVLSRRLHVMEDVLSFHFFHVVLATLSIFLLYALAYNVSGRRRIASFSALGLALLPQFVAHSQNNPKDLPGLFVFVLAIFTFTRLQPTSPFRHILHSGLALGLALTTHVSAVFLFPVLGIWHVVSRRMLPVRSYVTVVALATVTAFLCWPWLWSAPIQRLNWALRYLHGRFGYEQFSVLYLGTIYQGWELPWHYSLVNLLATTPVWYLVWTACSIFSLGLRAEGPSGSPWAAAALGWLWCAILIAAETFAPMRYDVARHLLMILPGLCLAAAVGFDAVLEWIARIPTLERSGRLVRAVTIACAAAAFASVAAEVVRIHPYQNAYLNVVTNAWIAGNAEDVFEVEYWGQSYKEGAEWLNGHAERDADIYVGHGPDLANHYLTTRSRRLTEETWPEFESQSRHAYLMLMTRKALYGPAITRVMRGYEPIFEVRRQKGTLLKLYSNRRPAADTRVGFTPHR